MGAMQVVYDKGKVSKVSHFPMNTLRAGKADEKGNITTWFYHKDWANKKPSEDPKPFKAFGFGNKKEIEIYIVKPYVSGFFYYAPIDYSGALPYAKLESEIADYLVNDVMNGFSGTKVVNFNNGVPADDEKRKEIANDVKRKVTGSKGDKVIISFNSSNENKTTVDDIPLVDAPQHYEYLSKECFEKLIVAHKITSPMLLGIRDTGSGLGNNADEIKTATLLLDNITVRPYQEEIIDALDEILAVNNISLNLYFKTLQPLEFIENATVDAETIEQETGVKLSEQHTPTTIADALIEKGEDFDSDWILIDESDVDNDLENDLDLEISELNNPKKTILQKLASIVAIPNAKSEQDTKIDGVTFKTRYKYGGAPNGEREFCNKMLNADKLYRKEDLERVDSETVNPGHGHEGQPYNVFLYKGGVNCKHKFVRQTFISAKDTNIDVNNPNAQKIAVAKAEELGYRIRNPKEVSMKPFDMPRNGHHPDYK
jgi:hypothetical protein